MNSEKKLDPLRAEREAGPVAANDGSLLGLWRERTGSLMRMTMGDDHVLTSRLDVVNYSPAPAGAARGASSGYRRRDRRAAAVATAESATLMPFCRRRRSPNGRRDCPGRTQTTRLTRTNGSPRTGDRGRAT